MEKWEILKNPVKVHSRIVDVLSSGSNISLLQNDVGYITSSLSGSYVTTSTFNTFTSSYYVDSSSFESRITFLENQSGSITSSFSTHFISTGSVSSSVAKTGDIFLITSSSIEFLKIEDSGTTTFNNNLSKPILKVSQSGQVNFLTQSSNPTGIAPLGGFWFTSHSLYIGLE